MQFTLTTDYALHSVLFLSGNPLGEVASGAKTSVYTGIRPANIQNVTGCNAARAPNCAVHHRLEISQETVERKLKGTTFQALAWEDGNMDEKTEGGHTQ